jgi:hypothetical protein
MKWLKLFEDFKDSKVSIDDIIECIEKGGSIYAQIVNIEGNVLVQASSIFFTKAGGLIWKRLIELPFLTIWMGLAKVLTLS